MTGKVVMLIGATLSLGVITWIFSPIKFQADMGLLLAFMFLGNMVAALILLPALAHFLLKPRLQASEVEQSEGQPASEPAINRDAHRNLVFSD